MARRRRLDPSEVTPLDVDGVRTLAVGTVLWAVAFGVLVLNRDALDERGAGWWLWTCLAGAGLGLLGLEYTRKRRDAIARAELNEEADKADQGDHFEELWPTGETPEPEPADPVAPPEPPLQHRQTGRDTSRPEPAAAVGPVAIPPRTAPPLPPTPPRRSRSQPPPPVVAQPARPVEPTPVDVQPAHVHEAPPPGGPPPPPPRRRAAPAAAESGSEGLLDLSTRSSRPDAGKPSRERAESGEDDDYLLMPDPPRHRPSGDQAPDQISETDTDYRGRRARRG